MKTQLSSTTLRVSAAAAVMLATQFGLASSTFNAVDPGVRPPLWGLGQRIFFLHDGRTSNLPAAIRAHASTGSEANAVVNAFQQLGELQKQQLLNFLRSL